MLLKAKKFIGKGLLVTANRYTTKHDELKEGLT